MNAEERVKTVAMPKMTVEEREALAVLFPRGYCEREYDACLVLKRGHQREAEDRMRERCAEEIADCRRTAWDDSARFQVDGIYNRIKSLPSEYEEAL